MNLVSLTYIKSHASGHFFDRDTTRFFSSRYPRQGYKVGRKVYFVTSEQFDMHSPRLYTVRVLNLDTGRIDSVGDFQKFKTSAEAMAAIKKKIKS